MMKTGLLRLDKLAMKKIVGGTVIAGCTTSGEVKCGRKLPCPTGCYCAGNRCFPDEDIAIENNNTGITVGD